MSMEADPLEAMPEACSDPPEESCTDAGCPVHGWDYDDGAAVCYGEDEHGPY